MDTGFYRGTNAEQDSRFIDKEKKLLKTMKFEPILDTKVDISKVNIEVIKPWIASKLNDLMNAEDDVLVEYVFTQLEEQNVNPKLIQINLHGFLNAKIAREFMGELWQIFVDAQASADGIPASIVEKKMEQLKNSSKILSNNESNEHTSSLTRATETDWKNRYQSLTGGRYGKDFSSTEHDEKRKMNDRSPLRSRMDRLYDRDERKDRNLNKTREKSNDKIRERSRDKNIRERDNCERSRNRNISDKNRNRNSCDKNRERSREYYARNKSRDRQYQDREKSERRDFSRKDRKIHSKSLSSDSPLRQNIQDNLDSAEKQFTKKSREVKNSDSEKTSDNEFIKKKRKKRKHHCNSDSETEYKKSKKHKKEKKKKHHKDKH